MESKRKPLKKRKFDRIDRNILRILQREGRISYTELSDRVGLSTTPCMERVKRLEKDGVIEGYYARIHPEALDYHMLVFVEISLSYQSPDAFGAFNQAVKKLPYIQECHLVSGDSDYLLKARISDMSQYRELLGDMLLTLPGVKTPRVIS